MPTHTLTLDFGVSRTVREYIPVVYISWTVEARSGAPSKCLHSPRKARGRFGGYRGRTVGSGPSIRRHREESYILANMSQLREKKSGSLFSIQNKEMRLILN